jgi:hypothetical protein
LKNKCKKCTAVYPKKDKRLYAGVEAIKLPYGGVSYIAELFGCSRNTAMRGIIDLGGRETIPRKRDRIAGGGRKQTVEIKDNGDIDELFLSILKNIQLLGYAIANPNYELISLKLS